MSDTGALRLLVGTWFLAFLMIGWKSFQDAQKLPNASLIDGFPQPSRLIKTSVVWTILGVISEGSPKLAATLGAGLLVPLFLMTQGEKSTSSIPSSEGVAASLAVGAIA
jgi:hypothetical protein